MNDRGMSDVVVTVLIILFSIVAVAVVGGIILSQISKAGKNINKASFCLENTIAPISCVQDSIDLVAGYQRKTNDNEIKSIESININIEKTDGSVNSVSVPPASYPNGNGYSNSYTVLGEGGSVKQIFITTTYISNDGSKPTCEAGPMTCEGVTTAGGSSTGGTGGNVAPNVNLNSPINGQTFTAGANINLEATADDSDGSVTKVEFFRDGSKLGEDTISPYSYSWNNVPASTYSLTAKATDNQGAVTTSDSVSITVSTPPASSGIPVSGYVGYWNFEGNYDDFTGNYDGVRSGDLSPHIVDVLGGSGNKAATFDGTTDEKVTVPSLNPTGNEITVIAWAKSDTPEWSDHSNMVSKRQTYLLAPTGLGGPKEYIVFYINCKGDATGAGAGWQHSGAVYATTLNKWHMYTGVFDGTYIKIYQDGIMKSSKDHYNACNPGIVTDNNNLYFGHDPDSQLGGTYLDGQLDEILIYDKGLDSTKISQIYNAQKGKFGIV